MNFYVEAVVFMNMMHFVSYSIYEVSSLDVVKIVFKMSQLIVI